MKKLNKVIISCLLITTLVISTLLTWVYSQIDSALPLLEGKSTIMGLKADVVINRDENGIPTIKATDRLDLAVATGFIHAQERFFQMDLLRRNAAGELSSLFGSKALEYDKSIRLHRFRERAINIIKHLPKEQHELIKAYTTGVNAGLYALNASPFEYLLLRQNPVEWQEEDSVLTLFSMYLDLQYKDGKRERTLGLIKQTFGEDIFAFLNPKGSQWDATIDGSQFTSPSISDKLFSQSLTQLNSVNTSTKLPSNYHNEALLGSNNWAVSGAISKTGSAIVANDMHLGTRVPNTWFRAAFSYTAKGDNPVELSGLTLPGVPMMIAGSNGNIAWGFTNSYGDWNDVITLQTTADNKQYLTPDGYKDFTEHKQIIAVNNQESVEITIKETIWGPVIGENNQQQLLALRWVAHDLQAVNFYGQKLELATTVSQAFEVAALSAIPAQNIMIGDKSGNIGWTIMGAIPVRSTQFGETPTSWADGTHTWQGYLAPSLYPKVINPVDNRLWTANSRVVGGESLLTIGNGGYALGARSQQIRDRLFEKQHFNEKDLLAIALDDEAIFLKRWQKFILSEVLDEETLKDKPQWQTYLKIVNRQDLHASVDSVAYRLIRNYRMNLRNSVFSSMNQQLEALDDIYSFHSIRHQVETPLWQLVTTQPKAFLTNNKSWQDYFINAFQQTIEDMTLNQTIDKATWGQQNTSKIEHPIAKAVPFLSTWLNMPSTPLAGDVYMPRVQGVSMGASERMIVSPGHEESGILHMPTSQAGHPWSPYFGKGHQDWEQGKPSSFLPGKTKYRLTLLNY